MTKVPLTKSARVKAMDYLARRDHSEQELRQKLRSRYPLEEIEPVLQELKERGWIMAPEDLSHKVATQMHQKLKGHLSISHFLRKKGLPMVPKDEDLEVDKAHRLIEQKVRTKPADPKQVASLLKNRGFDTETIGKIIHEVLRNSPGLY